MKVSKIALALKYRPKTFDDVIEQDAIKQTLKHQLDTGTIKNCYLFTGPAGCGKTTDARIFANEANGKNCTVIELDAASNNGVDDVRLIIEQAKYKSLDSKYKTFIIDECFSGNTPVKTPNGDIPIKGISVGDVIYNLSGKDIVVAKSENRVATDRLTKVQLSDENVILTTKDHLFFTQNGWKQAQLLAKGDELFDYKKLCNMWEELSMLSKRYKENLFQRMYEYLSCRNSKNESEGQTETNKEDLSDMSERVCNISFNQFNYLWNEVCGFIQETAWINRKAKGKLLEIQTFISVSCMWKDYDRVKQSKSQILFKRMCNSISERTESNNEILYEGSCLCYMWEYLFKTLFQQETDLFFSMLFSASFSKEQKTLFRKTEKLNENKQSFQEPINITESKTNKGEERYITSMDWQTWWKWSLYGTTDDFIQIIRSEYVGVGMCNTNKTETGFRLSDKLQGGYRKSNIKDWNRSGWKSTFLESWAVKGFEKSSTTEPTWVDSIEVYKRGNNEQSFTNYFTDSELHSEYVTMYDLQVKNHPSYFVNDILVHNCHMITPQGWAAFLKIVEEPPANALFIFATTDPQKIPNTILSRVQRYDFKKISFNGIVNRLKYIISQENAEENIISYKDEAIEYIAKLADGGMRDAITTLDKCISYNPVLTLDNVVKALGGVDYDTMFDLVEGIYNFDASIAIKITETIYMSGANIKQFVKDFNNFVLDLCKYGLLGSFEYLYIPNLYENRMKNYTNEHFTFFNQFLGELIKLNNTIKWESNPKPVIESTFVLLCQKA